MSRLLALAGVLLVAGCDLVSTVEVEPQDVAVAEVYLQVDTDVQRAFLYRTLQGEESQRLDGATVEVFRDDGTVLVFQPASGENPCLQEGPLTGENRGSCYESAAAPDFVLPERSYRLEISTGDGRRLEAATTVPGEFSMVNPVADTCVVDRGLDMAWTRSAGAWAYSATATFRGLADGLADQGIEDPPDTLRLLGLAVGEADTTIAFPNEFGVFDRFTLDRDVALALQEGLPAGAAADIVVAAGDRNLVNWVRGGNFNPSGQVRVPSVVGDGTGVFASLVPLRRTLLTDASGQLTCQ